MGKNKIKKLGLIEHENLPIVYNPVSRRMFLKASSGFLAIPFIASLLPKAAWSQAANENAFRKAVFMVNRHGGHWIDARPSGVQYADVGNGVRAGNLNTAQLGPIYSSGYNNLKSKVSVLMGLMTAGGIGHVNATALAASFSKDRNFSDGRRDLNEVSSYFPDSIDTVLASKIYPSNHPVKVLRFGGSHCYADQRPVSGITINAAYTLIMNNLVVPATPTAPTGPTDAQLENLRRRYILERTLSSISDVRASGKISDASKARIGDYQEMLAGVRDNIPSTITATPPPAPAAASCGNLTLPAQGDTQRNLRAQADLILAALTCGVTRLAYMSLPAEHEYVHRVSDGAARQQHRDYLRTTTLDVGQYLMNRMDQVSESNGKTLLDNSCVLITSDLGGSKFDNHTGLDMRVMVGGSLNGKLQVGKAVDYQIPSEVIVRSGTQMEQNVCAGRMYNELLISIMRGFGLQQSDYARGGRRGFGDYHLDELPHGSYIFNLVLSGNRDASQKAVLNYIKEKGLRNYNKDTALPYFTRT